MRDHRGVDALAAHGLREVLHDEGAVSGVVERLDVVIDIDQGRALVGDDHDAGGAGLLKHRLQGLGIDRHHADGVHALRDQVLHQLGLQGGVDLGGASLIDRVFGMRLGILIDADLHAHEPGIRGVLGDDDDLPALGKGRDAGEHQQDRKHQSKDFLHDVTLHKDFFIFTRSFCG